LDILTQLTCAHPGETKWLMVNQCLYLLPTSLDSGINVSTQTRISSNSRIVMKNWNSIKYMGVFYLFPYFILDQVKLMKNYDYTSIGTTIGNIHNDNNKYIIFFEKSSNKFKTFIQSSSRPAKSEDDHKMNCICRQHDSRLAMVMPSQIRTCVAC